MFGERSLRWYGSADALAPIAAIRCRSFSGPAVAAALEDSARKRHKTVMFDAEVSCANPDSDSRPIQANSRLLRRLSKRLARHLEARRR
jgi:hypothetical protein